MSEPFSCHVSRLGAVHYRSMAAALQAVNLEKKNEFALMLQYVLTFSDIKYGDIASALEMKFIASVCRWRQGHQAPTMPTRRAVHIWLMAELKWRADKIELDATKYLAPLKK